MRTNLAIVGMQRRCSRTGCAQAAVSTLTYVYADSVAVLGPLATYAEPHSYDLCAAHAERLSAPQGWSVIRLAPQFVEPEPTHDDLLALADAVREAGRPVAEQTDDNAPALRLVRSDSATVVP